LCACIELQLGQLRIAAVLVEAGAVTTVQDHRGLTALHLTADAGWVSATDFLLRNNADPNIKGGFAGHTVP
jgi:ankyrin repeat protein